MKQYIGIARDHSGSMNSLVRPAMDDYNTLIKSLKDASKKYKIDTIVSVAEFGNPHVNMVVTNSSVDSLEEMKYYAASSQTPMLDAVKELVDAFTKVPDYNSPDVSFLIMVITDGEENASRMINWNGMVRIIQQLQNTNRWTFTFRVPRGRFKQGMIFRGLAENNILEWEVTEAGLREATVSTETATQSYYEGRSRGVGATRNFFQANMNNIAPQDVRDNMQAITAKCKVWNVKKVAEIRKFCEANLPKSENWVKGAAFYQLTKAEKVQAYKKFLVRTKKSGAIYSGADARSMLKLPKTDEVKLVPGNHGDFDIFVQSTSVNRKLVPGTDLIYCVEAIQ